MLTELQKLKIKNWAKEVFSYLNTSQPDTTPERIRKNRLWLLPSFIERDDIDNLKDELPTQAKGFLKELIRLLYEYEHYFDSGFRSTENIDNLPDKIRVMLARIIKVDI